ncbi:hypothetical protein [Paenibacillus sp. JCM 10914]|uniref:hypothetical protein n=1 Tax=Paenibacillus sp. JCM 10914 TaxID=1236974 RepID=UPI00055BFB53|nr:hypothetical protein [Paenibacillus sp. JCM 10914]
MLYEGSSNYGGETELEITYKDNRNMYHYDLSGKLSSIRTKSGHLVNGTVYDKNGNTLRKRSPYYTLLENHDFREGGGMWQLGSNMSIASENSVDGNGSLKFSSQTAISSNSIAQAYSISAANMSDYVLTANILDNTSNGRVYVTWKEYNYYYGEVGSGIQLYSSEPGHWSRSSTSFRTSTMTEWITVQIIAEAGTVGTAYVDFVDLHPGVVVEGFEGDNERWGIPRANLTTVSTKAKEGAKSLRFNNSGSPITTSISYNKKIPVNQGIEYNLSAWFLNDLSSDNARLSIILYGQSEEGNTTESVQLNMSELRGSGLWFNKDISFVPKTTTRYYHIQLLYQNAAGSSYLDQLRLIPNPLADRDWTHAGLKASPVQ